MIGSTFGMEKDEEKLIIFLGKKIDNKGGERRKKRRENNNISPFFLTFIFHFLTLSKHMQAINCNDVKGHLQPSPNAAYN